MGLPFVNGESALYLGLNRNKESFMVDYTRTKRLEIVRALVQLAEVIKIAPPIGDRIHNVLLT